MFSDSMKFASGYFTRKVFKIGGLFVVFLQLLIVWFAYRSLTRSKQMPILGQDLYYYSTETTQLNLDDENEPSFWKIFRNHSEFRFQLQDEEKLLNFTRSNMVTGMSRVVASKRSWKLLNGVRNVTEEIRDFQGQSEWSTSPIFNNPSSTISTINLYATKFTCAKELLFTVLENISFHQFDYIFSIKQFLGVEIFLRFSPPNGKRENRAE